MSSWKYYRISYGLESSLPKNLIIFEKNVLVSIYLPFYYALPHQKNCHYVFVNEFSLYMSVYPSNYLSVCLVSIFLLCFTSSKELSWRLCEWIFSIYVCLSIYPSICLSNIFLSSFVHNTLTHQKSCHDASKNESSLYVSVCPSIRLSVCLISIYLPLCTIY